MQKKSILIISLMVLITAIGYMSFREAPRITRADVSIIGPVLLADGLGRQSVELALNIQNDFKTEIISRLVCPEDVPESVLSIIKYQKKKQTRYEDCGPLGKVVIVQGQVWKPSYKNVKLFKEINQEDQIRIAYSMLESTKIPIEWVEVLNTYYDAVVVPDPFLVQAYRESGVQIPIFQIPLGLDLQNFLKSPLKVKRNNPMVFANLSAADSRKNHVLLIRAFAQALGNNPSAILKINCRRGSKETIASIREELARQNCTNIEFTLESLSKESYLEFFKGIDCYVSLSKGEGFSIQPREAMALGIPVIATDNTGQSTICKSGLVRSVFSTLEEPAFYFGNRTSGGNFLNCNVDDAAAAIYDVYLHYEKYLAHASDSRQWAETYDYSNPSVNALYKNLICPKKVIFGDENSLSEELLVTNSQRLYCKYLTLTENGSFK
ncbi:MAG: glycosyltransferase family 1 protein [Chlamydiia bacterium]|nr:glycosyltransferase family 1 protein [Chlamydiia bacterium]